MLSNKIKKKIEAVFGTEIRYPKQTEALAASITKRCKQHISSTTLKRAFSFIKGGTPSLHTMDLISRYVGYETYDDLLSELLEADIKQKPGIESVICKSLPVGAKFKVCFGKVAFIEVEYVDKNLFRVVNQEKTSLLPEDLIEVTKVEIYLPLLVRKIIRSEVVMKAMVLGKNSSVTEIIKLK